MFGGFHFTQDGDRPLAVVPAGVNNNASIPPSQSNPVTISTATTAAAVTATKTAASKPACTESQKNRREKAKIHARRCREKKKREQEGLHEQERLLREENQRLRALVRSKIPDHAQKIVSECCYSSERLKHLNPYAYQQLDEGGTGAAAELAQNDFDLIESLAAGRQSFVLTDPRLPDNPIVYCSAAFCNLTGYSREQVVGRNCRFLQTPETDPNAVEAVRRAIDTGSDATTVLLNAKADGTPFWNRFFVAALRSSDRSRIVNYVGVQTETDPPEEHIDGILGVPVERASTAAPELNIKRIPSATAAITATFNGKEITPIDISPMPVKLYTKAASEENSVGEDTADSIGHFDWAILAEALDKDYANDAESEERNWGDQWIKLDRDDANDDVSSAALDQQLHDFLLRPRLFTTKVVRSEVIHALLSSYGDVSDARFTSALDVLTSMYRSSGVNMCSEENYLQLLNGSWRSLSRPAYKGCLGMKSDGSFCYSLQTMSFGMFRPGTLRCSIQHTLTHISNASKRADEAPTIAPWSLRRELAVLNGSQCDENGKSTSQQHSTCMLKSYDIAISLTIEPGEDGPAPKAAIHALKVVKGYTLPDPSVPNRLTIWFVAGRLSPVSSYSCDDNKDELAKNGDLNEWKSLFGGDQKKTWSESFRDMGAKLLLGAELPAGMASDGTLSYQMHRPHGGHGVAYIDILYYDENVMITRGNKGTIYCATRDGSSTPPSSIDSSSGVIAPSGLPQTEGKASVPPPAVSVENKRKIPDAVLGFDAEERSTKRHRSAAEMPKRAKISPSPQAVVETTSAVSTGNPFQSVESHKDNAGDKYHDGGVRNILHSVEAFFKW